ncbi:hypothetical protein OMP38_27595 [Cohnella ginsengisoli]|uniref:Uncharacterized protein n=1 Tax=Cohnella ginsengisoli TaxID=425004 RepID=A0A9X4QQ44_9BACL|nr:hypothetical protein [Cohnella ginsengisoli]MDG0794181.1 hypothetical protein [Cohnella ginsengisoli]
MKRIITNLGVLQIFFSLLLVIAIMFVSTYLIYRNSISGIYDKVTQNNTLVFKSVVQSFDDSFRTVDNIIHSVHSLPPSDNLISPDDDSLDMTKVYTLVKNLSTLTSTVDYIEEVVVFYDDARLAITSEGTSGFERFFDGKYRHDTYNANYWKTYASTKHAFKIFPADSFKVLDFNQQPQTRNLMIAFGGNKLATSSKNVMVMIDVAALLKHVNQQSVIPGASLILLDQDRNIIYSTDKQWGLVDVLNDVYFNADQEASLTRENYEYNFYKSDYNGFIYIDKVPYQFQNLNPVTQANDSIMLTAIVCAVALSVFLSFYLNRPVKRILRLLGGRAQQRQRLSENLQRDRQAAGGQRIVSGSAGVCRQGAAQRRVPAGARRERACQGARHSVADLLSGVVRRALLRHGTVPGKAEAGRGRSAAARRDDRGPAGDGTAAGRGGGQRLPCVARGVHRRRRLAEGGGAGEADQAAARLHRGGRAGGAARLRPVGLRERGVRRGD